LKQTRTGSSAIGSASTSSELHMAANLPSRLWCSVSNLAAPELDPQCCINYFEYAERIERTPHPEEP
jgi:hypothetical protein